MRRTRSHLFETLYILLMITLIASVLIGTISWVGRHTLNAIFETADSTSRAICSEVQGQPSPATVRLGWEGLADIPLNQWPAHISSLLQAGADEDCATSYDPDYTALTAYADHALQQAQKATQLSKTHQTSQATAYQIQASSLTPDWLPLSRWAVSQGYVLLQRPTRDIVADVATLASFGGEILGVNDMVRALDLNGLLAAVGGESIASEVQAQLTNKIYDMAGTANPAFTQVTLLTAPQMQVRAAPIPLKGYVAAMPFSVMGLNGANDKLWLVLHIIQADPLHPEALSVKRWLSRPLP